MNIFDFITGPRQPYPINPEEQRKRELLLPRTSPTVATPMWNPISLQPTPVDRAVGSNTSAVRMELSPSARLEDQRRKTRELQDFENNPVKNNDRGFWGRLLDVGRQAIVSAGQQYNAGSGTPTERLMGALGGGIAGGLYGGFHPQVDEERQRLYDIGRSQQLEGELEGQIQRDQARVLTDARIAAIPEEQRIRQLQIESTERAKALAEIGRQKKFDPKNPLDVERAIRAGLDPAKMVAFDDRDPKTIKLGNDFLQLDRTDGKWKIAGTRGDLVDWKLSDGRVVSIPAGNAAYNETMMSINAQRIESTNRNADNRIVWDREKFGQVHALANKQFTLAEQKYRDAKTAEERKAAMELMQDALTRIDGIIKNQDLDEESKSRLIELQNEKSGLFGSMSNR